MIKVSLIVLCGLAAMALLRHRSAAMRHFVLAAAIICAGASPLVEPIVPSWRLPLHPSLFGRSVEPLTLVIPVPVIHPGEDSEVSSLPASSGGWRFSASRTLSTVWLAGALCGVSVLLVGLARLRRLASTSETVLDAHWMAVVEQLSRGYGIRRRVLLRWSPHGSLLATWGTWRPTIMLPSSARDWSDERLRVVLGHELAHIGRGDWLIHMAAEILRAIYWFNPLMWIACWRLRAESEQACDDAVLRLGIQGPDYATHLLDLARLFKQSRTVLLPAAAVARPSTLERRIRAMLNSHVNRAPITRMAGIASIVVAVALAAVIVSAQSSTASFSGVLVDAVGRILPNTTLLLTNVQTGEKHETTSDSTAHFAFAGLVAGDYTLNVDRMGFAASQGRVTLDAGQQLVRDVALQVAALNETIRVTASVLNGSKAPSVTKPRAQKTPTESSIESCTASQVGGDITPPLKLADKKPVYPPQEQAAGVGAQVALDVRIGTDGVPRDFRLTAPANQDFVQAVTDAVSQWRFSQTKLDCVPVEVTMHVSATFAVE